MGVLYFNTFRNQFQYDATLQGEFTDANSPIPFAYGTAENADILVNKVQFGDGYEQRGMSGIVGSRKSYPLVFEKKSDKVVQALRNFFLGQPAGQLYHRTLAEPFFLLLPPPYMAETDQPKKFVVETFNVATVEYNSSTVTVTVKEWFGA